MKFLGAPRIGMSRVEVPNAEPYVHETEEELTARLDCFFNLAKAIEDRGLGSIQAQQLAKRLANAAQIMPSPRFKALGAASATFMRRARSPARLPNGPMAIASQPTTATEMTFFAPTTKRASVAHQFSTWQTALGS
jgi:hypothetical protein